MLHGIYTTFLPQFFDRTGRASIIVDPEADRQAMVRAHVVCVRTKANFRNDRTPAGAKCALRGA